MYKLSVSILFICMTQTLQVAPALAADKPITITTQSCELKAEQSALFFETIKRIDDTLARRGVELPAKVTLRMGKQAGAGFSSSNGDILLPCDEDQIDVALAHEYGHLIFEQHLRGVIKNRAWLFARKEELHKTHGSPQELALIVAELLRQQKVAAKYGELFADLVAVIYARDGAAMVKLLLARNKQLPPDRYVLRDFSRFHAREWRQLPETSHYDPHLVFHPVKVSLWLEFASRDIEALAALSPLVLKTELAEVTSGINDPEAHAKRSVAELNRQLIRELRALGPGFELPRNR